MSRTMVFKEPDGDQVPFLRGILTQSLVKSGLSFDDAYGLAQTVRADLKDESQISTDDLRGRVSKMLAEQFGEDQCRVYLDKPKTESDIIVHSSSRSETFSVGMVAHSLGACAIHPFFAITAAHRVHDELLASGVNEISARALRRVVYENLCEHTSEQIADRYLSWRRFEDSGDPLVIMLGGVTGSGKSTLATELSYRLDIARTQSTDMIREIIRSYITLEVAPTLQYSSFEAWRGLPNPDTPGRRKMDNPVVTGFLSQFNVVKPALDAAVARALQEREHVILEGVHVVPTELDFDSAGESGIVLPVMIATTQKRILKQRLQRRGTQNMQRAAERHINHIDEIWELQAYLLSAADAAGIAIIQNIHLEDTIQELLEVLSRLIMKRFPAEPDEMDWGA